MTYLGFRLRRKKQCAFYTNKLCLLLYVYILGLLCENSQKRGNVIPETVTCAKGV